MEQIKVLSLDGGGVKGYLTAKILSNLEQYLNQQDNSNTPLGLRFDLIVGTSTGGIIACALAVGKTAKEILELYQLLIPEVFQPISCGYLSAKYSNKKLKEYLEDLLGEKTLGDVKTHLCATSVCIENSSPRFHKSGYFERNLARLDERLVDVALATSAAPTFFPSVNTKHSTNLTDGGVVANNPSMVALIDALELTDNNFENITMVSVGTGEQCHMPYSVSKLEKSGKVNWMVMNGLTPSKKTGSPLIEIFLESQSKLIHFQTQFLLKKNYIRINPKLSFEIELDDANKIESLKNIADIAKEEIEKVLTLLS